MLHRNCCEERLWLVSPSALPLHSLSPWSMEIFCFVSVDSIWCLTGSFFLKIRVQIFTLGAGLFFENSAIGGSLWQGAGTWAHMKICPCCGCWSLEIQALCSLENLAATDQRIWSIPYSRELCLVTVWQRQVPYVSPNHQHATWWLLMALCACVCVSVSDWERHCVCLCVCARVCVQERIKFFSSSPQQSCCCDMIMKAEKTSCSLRICRQCQWTRGGSEAWYEEAQRKQMNTDWPLCLPRHHRSLHKKV